jgi:3-hydroxyisobutyrate dehydrogenase-like beta-hydroxyacid dehydrogenase
MFTTIERLGFAGLGAMGAGIARRLAGAGHDVTVWNRTREKAEGLGLAIADGPGELAASVDVLFTMLTNTAAIEATAERIIPALRPGTMSPI